MGFLYFVEGVATMPRDALNQAGLGYVVGPRGVGVRQSLHGPGGQGGVVLGESETPIGYWPDKQDWRPIGPDPRAEGRRIWIGRASDGELPTPGTLERRQQLSGHVVRLRDGRDWQCPAARQFSDGALLRRVPARLELDDSGLWVPGRVMPEYERLWEVAERFLAWFTGGDDRGSLPIHDATDMAVECLATNYRIGRVEASILGLFDDQGLTAIEVLKAAIDWPTFEAWQKKTDASTDAG